MPDANSRSEAAGAVILEFELQHGIAARDIAALLQDLDYLFSIPRRIAFVEILSQSKPNAVALLEDVLDVHMDSLRVEGLAYGSPLHIAGHVGSFVAKNGRAIARFLANVVHYREEKSRRGAIAAQEWENVLAKRIENTRDLINLVSTTISDETARAKITQRVLGAALNIQSSPARLTDFTFLLDDAVSDNDRDAHRTDENKE